MLMLARSTGAVMSVSATPRALGGPTSTIPSYHPPPPYLAPFPRLRFPPPGPAPRFVPSVSLRSGFALALAAAPPSPLPPSRGRFAPPLPPPSCPPQRSKVVVRRGAVAKGSLPVRRLYRSNARMLWSLAAGWHASVATHALLPSGGSSAAPRSSSSISQSGPSHGSQRSSGW